jgi:hypothetical protein
MVDNLPSKWKDMTQIPIREGRGNATFKNLYRLLIIIIHI